MKNGGGGKSSPAIKTTTQTINPHRMKKMKHPRTMNEAFPHTMEYGAAIEIHVAHHTLAEKVIRVLALVGFIVLALDFLVWRP